jgi:hypothetical protein
VKQDGAVRLDVPEVKLQGLAREQMDRNAIAGEGVDYQHVEVLRWLLLERGARVAEVDRGDVRLRLREIGEVRPRDLRDLRIELIEDDRPVARCRIGVRSAAGVRRQRADAEPDRTDPERGPFLVFGEELVDHADR